VVTRRAVNSHGTVTADSYSLWRIRSGFAGEFHGEHEVTQHATVSFLRTGRIGETADGGMAVDAARGQGQVSLYTTCGGGEWCRRAVVVEEHRGTLAPRAERYFAEG